MFANETDATATDTVQLSEPSYYSKWIGPYLVGLVVQMYMMGILSIQVWNYYLYFPKDKRIYKVLVGTLMSASVMQCGTDFYLLYRGFVIGFGRVNEYLLNYDWTYFYEPAWTGFMAAVCQSFFLHRCFVITKSYIVAGLGAIGILLAFSSSIALSVASSKKEFGITENSIWMITSAVVDVFLSSVLIWHLRRTETSFESTEKILVKVTRLAMETAALTSCLAVAAAASSLGFAKVNGSHLAFDFMISKAYFCSVMVTLGSRRSIARENSGINVTSTSAHNRQLTSNGVTVTTTRLRVVEDATSDRIAYDIPMKSMNPSDETSIHDRDPDKVAKLA